MSAIELLNQLKKIQGKFEKDMGLRIWGVDSEGNVRLIRVDEDGKLATAGP